MPHAVNTHNIFIPSLIRFTMEGNVAESGNDSDVFHFGSQLCKVEELRDHLNCIRDLCSRKIEKLGNIKSAEDVSVVCGFHSWGDTSEFIIMLCQHWKLPDETRYKAIEILSRFMSSLIAQLYEVIHGRAGKEDSIADANKSKESGHISSDLEAGNVFSAADRSNHQGWINNEKEGQSQSNEWEETLEHIKSQMKLRAVTAIMIASKVTSHEHIITLNKAVDMLIKQNHIYSKNVIVKSELRMLNTINYNLRLLDTPYPCMMVLLEILCRIDDRFIGKKIHEICIHLLDLYYYSQPKVLSVLSQTPVSESGLPHLKNQKDLKTFLTICYDVLKICGALVSAAVYLYNRKLSDIAIMHLCEIVETNEDRMLRSCGVVLRILLQKDF